MLYIIITKSNTFSCNLKASCIVFVTGTRVFCSHRTLFVTFNGFRKVEDLV